jgi:ElaB/YqjD/DUF883 family membrane-anchored ribosome-binding protein
MAEPARDESLSSMRFPGSPSSTASRPGPVPVETPAEGAALIPDTLPDRRLGEWPSEEGTIAGTELRSSSPALDTTGERVGSALGSVVNQTKELSSRVQDWVRDLKQKFQVITSRRSSGLKDRASELSDEAQERASELAKDARRQVRRWEFRVRLHAREKPLQFVGTAAAVGFVIGFVWRMWREE